MLTLPRSPQQVHFTRKQLRNYKREAKAQAYRAREAEKRANARGKPADATSAQDVSQIVVGSPA